MKIIFAQIELAMRLFLLLFGVTLLVPFYDCVPAGASEIPLNLHCIADWLE